MDIGKFRIMFPEFADTTAYSEPMLSIWMGIGSKLINEQAWGDDLVDYGIGLITAHLAANRKRGQLQGARPGGAGTIEGVKTAASVDKVSKSMDVGAVTLADGGFWNTTSYGVELMTLMRMIGAGGMQL